MINKLHPCLQQQFYLLIALLYIPILVSVVESSSQSEYANRKVNSCRSENGLVFDQENILLAEQLLAHQGYWVGAVDGIIDDSLYQAIIAFQKVQGRKLTGKLTCQELSRLKKAKRPIPRIKTKSHIEIDLRRQILFVVDDNRKIQLILPVTTGTGKQYLEDGKKVKAETPTGRFTVYRKLEGRRETPLGVMFYPNYIVRGIAIHGSISVPIRPATYGCIGLPMEAASDFSKMAPIGTEVFIYGRAPSVKSLGRDSLSKGQRARHK